MTVEAPFNYWGVESQVVTYRRAEELILREIDGVAHDEGGLLKVLPAAVYAGYDPNELSLWCVRRGYYCLPTIELVLLVKQLIGERSAVEIGSGHGALGRALGIPTTDSKMQDRPDISVHYERIGQATTTYPESVEKLTALEAVEKYKPKVVVAAWVTHRFNEKAPEREGNQYGVDEGKLLGKPFVKRYIFVGHERVHRKKPILERKHDTYKGSFLHGRPTDREGNVVWVWDCR